MKIIKNKRSVQTSSKLQKNKFSIKASKLAKNRKIIKASSESYSMSDYDIVMYRNTEKVYSGSVYDSKFDNIIKALCKDAENIKVFREWLLDYGLSDFEDIDVSGLVVDMIISEWEEATNDIDDFYIEISMYGHKHSDVRFEVFYAKDEVTASTSTKRKYTVKASKKISASQWDDVDEDGYSDSDEVWTSQDESLIDELWNACDDIGGLQDIEFDSEDTDGTHIIFIYGDSTNDYDTREAELIEALQAAGYNAEYDANNGSNVIVLHVTRFVNESISVRKKSITAAQADTAVSQEDVDELVLYITNDGYLYRSRTTPIIKNLKRKVESGTYDRDLAVKAWQYLADDGVRMYDKEFGSGKGSLSWLNPATRKAIATELRDYYEEEIFYEDSVSSSTAIHAVSEVDVDEVKSAIKQAGITVWDVKRSEIHTGYIYEVVLDNPDDSTAAIEAIRSAGFTVTFDTVSGNSMFVYIEDTRLENAFLYRVSFEYTSEIVRMSDETSNEQDVLDACIDQMEADGKTGYLYTMDEVEQQGWYEDEYVIGGNHSLALYHGGNFYIEPLGWSDDVGNITAAVGTNHDSIRTYGTDSKRDVEYLNALAEGVTNNLNDYWGDITQITYEISDSAITFNNESDVVYIQPIDQIEPNWDDLDTDIEELETSIQSELLPKF